jgi:hypothetical protein
VDRQCAVKVDSLDDQVSWGRTPEWGLAQSVGTESERRGRLPSQQHWVVGSMWVGVIVVVIEVGVGVVCQLGKQWSGRRG